MKVTFFSKRQAQLYCLILEEVKDACRYALAKYAYIRYSDIRDDVSRWIGRPGIDTALGTLSRAGVIIEDSANHWKRGEKYIDNLKIDLVVVHGEYIITLTEKDV